MHPAEEKLLSYVDDELSGRQASRVRAHLGACWPCRTSLDRIEQTIALFVEFQNQILAPATPPPPGNWSGFGDRLRRADEVRAARPKSRLGSIAHRWNSFFTSLRPSNWSPPTMRGFAVSVAALVIVAVVWQLIAVSTVTASELLDKALTSEQTAVEAVSQAVVYRKLRVQRQGGEAFDLEVWRDAANGRYKRLSPPAIAGGAISGFSNALARNRMDARKPLSAESFKNWHDSLVNKTDNVERATGADSQSIVELTTVTNSAKQNGDLIQAILRVRESDYHAVSEELRLKNGESEETYSLTELEFRVVSLSDLRPDFFDNAVTPQIADGHTSSLVASPETSPETEASVTAPPPAAMTGSAPNAAIAENEIEVLQILNQVKADLGEQITVTRENGFLFVRGIVETDSRKREILNALQPVAGRAGVRIEIHTLAEALTAERNKSKRPTSVEKLETDSDASAVESELVQHFGSVEAARAFSTRVVSRSRNAQTRIYALKRLVAQFSTEELKQMKPDARAKWLAIVARHAAAYRAEIEGLRVELQDVFGAVGGGSAATPNVNDWTNVAAAVSRLAELDAANDQVIRSTFAVSGHAAQISAIRGAQFWQNLHAAESLAGKLAALK